MNWRAEIGTTTWETKHKVKLLSLEPYRDLFPLPKGIDRTIYKETTVDKTVYHIPEVVKKFAWQVEKFVDQELMGLSLMEACKKLWWFVRFHIEWVQDGIHETIRTPAVLIYEAKGDCDCMTNFINTCLHIYKVRTLINRTAGYDPILKSIAHIYTVVPTLDGKQIIIDACWPKFNSEKPYVIKKDYTMELHVLEGIGDTEERLIGVDAQDLFGLDADLGELGKLLKKKSQSGGGEAPAKKGIFKKSPEKKAAAKEKRKAIGKKVLKVANKINKINPATVLLRAGILASMKLNIGKVAERIKWGYASPELAQSKGMDMSKYEKVKEVLAKTQSIFYAAGGNPESLKKSILTGHGNRHKEVSGFGELNGSMSLSQLLGDVYTTEFVNGMEGFAGFGGIGDNGLGEPATAASVAAASTAMGALAALLKSIGDLFPNKGKKNAAAAPENSGESASEPTEPGAEETPQAESAESQSTEETDNLPSAPSEETEIAPAEESGGASESAESENTDGLSGPFSTVSSFYQKNKGWILPVGGLALAGAVAYWMNKKSSPGQKPSSPPDKNLSPALSGSGGSKYKHRYHGKGSKPKKQSGGTKTVLALK